MPGMQTRRINGNDRFWSVSKHDVAACLIDEHERLLQADKSRVKDYIHRLDNFDGPAVGEIAAGYEMFEEAFEIYKKFNLKVQAIKVLLDNMDDFNRAKEYATKVSNHSQPICLPGCSQFTCLLDSKY